MNESDPRLETLFTPAMALSSGFAQLESYQQAIALYWRVMPGQRAHYYWRVMPGQRAHYCITYRHVVVTLTSSRKLAESLVRARGRQLDA